MRRLFQTYPDFSRLVLGALLITLALILSGFIPAPNFPFGGPILVIVATWCICHTENKELGELGFDLKRRNLLLLPAGLVLGRVAFLAGFYAKSWVTGEHWNINRHINYTELFRQRYVILASAVVQEFIVRDIVSKS